MMCVHAQHTHTEDRMVGEEGVSIDTPFSVPIDYLYFGSEAPEVIECLLLLDVS